LLKAAAKAGVAGSDGEALLICSGAAAANPAAVVDRALSALFLLIGPLPSLTQFILFRLLTSTSRPPSSVKEATPTQTKSTPAAVVAFFSRAVRAHRRRAPAREQTKTVVCALLPAA
jgi:hypothetical protein